MAARGRASTAPPHPRYHVGKVLDEAKEVFEPTIAPRDFDLIELPFPERGEPQLVSNGARDDDQR